MRASPAAAASAGGRTRPGHAFAADPHPDRVSRIDALRVEQDWYVYF
ncbi:hypothetical protein FHR81_002446 [Actinoalloteichus hoggarensis]|nr:hypothetical protein [Actinoalloteichus hoggarensis]MBB5921406.1 hypothetical protein [Actinoalloteichus hoggarensis]